MSSIKKKLIKLKKEPRTTIINHTLYRLEQIHFFDSWSDEKYISFSYRLRMNKKLNLDNPQTLNEKIQWLKINYKNDKYPKYVDKYEVKKIVEKIVGSEYVPTLLGVYNNFADIKFDVLPDKFVIKTTHDSGGYVICTNKNALDIVAAEKKICKSLKHNYYYHSREWPYKNIKPRIIIEEFIEGENGEEMKDYKFFCFNGEPKVGFCVENRNTSEMKMSFYDMEFKQIPVKQGGEKYKLAENMTKPYNFKKMIELSKVLSKNMPFVRIDFLEAGNKLYVGEFTFFHWGGTTKFEPEKYDKIFGDLLILPQ